MLSLLVIAFLFGSGDFALMPLLNKEYNVRQCVKHIIDVYADPETTIFAIYGNGSRGNFMPHPIPNLMISINVHEKIYKSSYQTRKELVIMDSRHVDLHLMEKLGFLDYKDLLKRKFLFTWSHNTNRQVEKFFNYFWDLEILDVIFLSYDYSPKSNFTEVITSDKHHPSNKCGTVARNVSRFSCDNIKKKRKQKFYRNYSKCRLTYRYETLFQDLKIERNYITEFILSEIIATLNLTCFMKHKHTATTNDDHYLLVLLDIKYCRNKFMFCGKPFTDSIHVWTVPSPKKLGSLEVFKLIYKWECWIFILLSFVVTCLVWWAISTCRWSTRFSSSILDVYSITLTSTINRVPKCFSLRCLFLAYVIYSVHIQIGFKSNLVTLLTVPQSSMIKSTQELADSNIPIIISRSSKSAIFNMSHEGNNILKKIKDNIIVLSNEEWFKSVTNEQSLESVSFMIAMDSIYLLIQKFQRKVYFIPDELIRHEVFAFNTRPGCPIVEDFNKVINSLVESGIIEHKKGIYKKIAKNFVKNYEETQVFTENVVLGMEHVYPIFLLWVLGILVALIVFVLEHVTYTVKNN